MGFPEGEHRFIVFGIRNLDTGEYLNVKVSRIPPTLHATARPVQLSLIFHLPQSGFCYPLSLPPSILPFNQTHFQ